LHVNLIHAIIKTLINRNNITHNREIMSDLYLRDLTGTIKEEVEADIRKHCPDLVELMEAEEDIIIGEIFDHKKYNALAEFKMD